MLRSHSLLVLSQRPLLITERCWFGLLRAQFLLFPPRQLARKFFLFVSLRGQPLFSLQKKENKSYKLSWQFFRATCGSPAPRLSQPRPGTLGLGETGAAHACPPPCLRRQGPFLTQRRGGSPG